MKADKTTLAIRGRILADDLCAGHYSMRDAIAMIRELCDAIDPNYSIPRRTSQAEASHDWS